MAEHAHKIATLRSFCTRVHGAECRRCELACPAEAVSFSDDGMPAIDEDACTLCGICLGICDAFTSSHVTMDDVHARFQRIAKRGEDVVVTCEENLDEGVVPAANVVALPCLAALSPEFWTVVLAENMTIRIAADLGRCKKCQRAGSIAEMLYMRAIETAESYVERKVGYQKVIPEKENLVKDYTNPADVDRRGAFENVYGDVMGIATGKRRLRNSTVLNDYVERREKARARARLHLADGIRFENFAPAGQRRKTLMPKRRLLLSAIACEPAIAGRVPLLVAAVDTARCTGARACLDACPTGALQDAVAGAPPALDARYCIACGLCAQACAASAIDLVEVTADALAEPETHLKASDARDARC